MVALDEYIRVLPPEVVDDARWFRTNATIATALAVLQENIRIKIRGVSPMRLVNPSGVMEDIDPELYELLATEAAETGQSISELYRAELELRRRLDDQVKAMQPQLDAVVRRGPPGWIIKLESE